MRNAMRSWLVVGLLGGALLLCGVGGLAQSGPLAQAPAAPKQANKSVVTTGKQEQDSGERAFQTHCSRCHTAPEQITPRIAGTIVRHMRVRASLSAADERAILQYLAP